MYKGHIFRTGCKEKEKSFLPQKKWEESIWLNNTLFITCVRL